MPCHSIGTTAPDAPIATIAAVPNPCTLDGTTCMSELGWSVENVNFAAILADGEPFACSPVGEHAEIVTVDATGTTFTVHELVSGTCETPTVGLALASIHVIGT